MNVDWNVLAALALAPIAGAILGLPSQLSRRPAGIRTHALVALGAAMFCIVAIHRAEAAETGDAIRAIQGVASGVGFIGAATIIKGDGVVRGINTAATVWIAAAVGTAMGVAETPAIGVVGAAFATAINWLFMEVDTRAARTHDDYDQAPPAGTGQEG